MNILLFSRGYPSINDLQWGCFEKDQAIALQKLGHKVVFISIDGRFRFQKIGISHKKDQEFDIYNFYLFPFKFLRLFGINFFLRVLQWMVLKLFFKVKKEFTPDVIYAHYLPNIYSSSIIKEKTGIPIVGIEHWSKLNQDTLEPFVKEMGKTAYKSVDCLVSVSESLRQRIKNHFGYDSIVIHNMVGLDFDLKQIQNKNMKGNYPLNILTTTAKRKRFSDTTGLRTL